MSILIKGMEMPTSCDVCRFAIDGFCYASGKVNVSAVEERQVTNYCPLVPVPPHGRLIDADAFEEFIRKDWDKNDHWIADIVYSRPTIIPAEEADDYDAINARNMMWEEGET